MLNRLASLAVSPSVLKALPGKLDIKRHSPSILNIPLRSHMLALVFFTFCTDSIIHARGFLERKLSLTYIYIPTQQVLCTLNP